MDEDSLGLAQYQRSRLGFPTDTVTVAALLLDPQADDMFGVPLSVAEQADVLRRLRVQEALDPVEAYGAARPETYGGIYIDQQAGGEVVVSFTADVDQHAIALAELGPAEGRLRVRAVSWTEAELKALSDSLYEDFLGPGSEDVGISSTRLDVRENAVVVGIQEDEGEALDVLQARYGGRPIMVERADHPVPTTREDDDPPPLRGGIGIYRRGTTSNGYGLGLPMIGLSGHRWQTTAGHADTGGPDGQEGQVGSYWEHGWPRETVGDVRFNYYYDYTRTDVMLIRVPDSWGSRKLYLSETTDVLLSSVQGRDTDRLGDYVCMSGSRSLLTCGDIISVNYDVTYYRGAAPTTEVILQDQRLAAYGCRTGDSGSPVYMGSGTAVGAQSGGRRYNSSLNFYEECIYSHAYWIETISHKTIFTGSN